jgi:RimJ/RimL family protein N-acetyltransferase
VVVAIGVLVSIFERCQIEGQMLNLVIAEQGVGELGAGLILDARGRGIATEALRHFATWCLDGWASSASRYA